MAGAVTPGHTFTDYAELFENVTAGIIPVGVIVSRIGRKVQPGIAGDKILGVVSETAGIILGDAPFTWQGRYKRKPFGGKVKDNKGRNVDSEDFKPVLDYTSRQDRPEEWSTIGIMGQVFVRTLYSVEIDDYIGADGNVSVTETRLQAMEVKAPYDFVTGYGITLCMLL